MDSSLELKKYQLIEYLMTISDLKLLEVLEKFIDENQSITEKEMVDRANIAEQQFKDGKYKTSLEAKERLSKWTK